MMHDHRRSRLRYFGGAAAITLLGGISATFGSAGIAHPHPEGETSERTERIIVMKHKQDGDGAGHAERSFNLRLHDDGEVALPNCPADQTTEVDEGEGNERTRIVLCSRGDASPADRAEHLQRARDRLAGDSDLSEAQRARVTAALDREIARLRGQ